MRKMLAAIIIIIMVLNSGCVERKSVNDTKTYKIQNNIVYNLGKFPDDLFMLSNTNVRDKDLLLSLFEGLIKVDEAGKIVPGLAENWTLGKDNITYTFNIRDNAKWSDGSDITANDFVNYFSECLNFRTDNVYADQLYYIFGAQEYRNNKKSFNGVAVSSVDDKTLKIRLNSPCSNFLEILSKPVFTLRKLNNDLKDWLDNYKNVVYSGPFKIDDIAEKKEITLVKNEFYWGKYQVPSDKIFIKSLEGSEISLAEFQTGKINVFSNPPMSEVNGLIADNEAEIIPINSGVSLIYNLNKKGIVRNLNFRKAINSAIDREEIVDNNLNGVSRSAAAYIPSDTEDGEQSFNRKAFFKDFADVDEGKKLLQDSQYDKKEKIKLVYLNDDKNKRLCEAFAKNIKDTLGINIESSGYNGDEMKEVIKNNKFDILQIDYTALYDDPNSFLEQWISTSQWNIGGYRNIDFDNMILKAKLEKDQTKRDEILQKAEELLVSDMPAVPISFYNLILCKNPKIQNIYVTRQGNIKLDRAYINNN